MLVRSRRFQRRFKQVSKYEFAIFLAIRKFDPMRLQIRILNLFETSLKAPNEIANLYFETCLKRR